MVRKVSGLAVGVVDEFDPTVCIVNVDEAAEEVEGARTS